MEIYPITLQQSDYTTDTLGTIFKILGIFLEKICRESFLHIVIGGRLNNSNYLNGALLKAPFWGNSPKLSKQQFFSTSPLKNV